jgi:DNA-binding GntR family transcriptional regulator
MPKLVTVARASPRRLMLADGTYDLIKSMILDHAISPGEHIGIDALARSFSVSQTPVREALARLEADGLVTKTPLRGYEATDMLTIREFDELFRFRAVVEPWAAAQAARRGSPRDVDGLEAELATAGSIPREGMTSAYTEFVEHDTRFHALVARASGNQFVEDAFLRTHCHLHLFRVYKATVGAESVAPAAGHVAQDMFEKYYRGGQRPLALTEHIKIVAAIKRGEEASAESLMLDHIESSRRRFIQVVEALNPESVTRTTQRKGPR